VRQRAGEGGEGVGNGLEPSAGRSEQLGTDGQRGSQRSPSTRTPQHCSPPESTRPLLTSPWLRRSARSQRSPLARYRAPALLAAAAAVALGAAQLLRVLDPVVGGRLTAASSTDWPTLARDPVLPWITSVVWVPDGPRAVLLWLAVVPAALALLADSLGVRRALIVGGAAHVLASLGSEAVLGIRYLSGAISHDVLRALDVGPSYLAVGVVAGLVAAGGTRRRRLGAAVVLAALLGLPQIGLLDGLDTLAVAPVGHLLASLVGAAAAALLSAGAAPRAAGRPAGSRGGSRRGRSRTG